jgi:hypothetical protein
MLLKIDVNPKDIVFNENGRIIIKLEYYSQFATAAHLSTVSGSTKKDFDTAKSVKKQKTLFVGTVGGISLE